jgi:hypothetical protein
VATVSMSGGINMPMWQRLPSRNLSFQSAEILTVTECLQHTNLSSYLDRSVRLTGLFWNDLCIPIPTMP